MNPKERLADNKLFAKELEQKIILQIGERLKKIPRPKDKDEFAEVMGDLIEIVVHETVQTTKQETLAWDRAALEAFIAEKALTSRAGITFDYIPVKEIQRFVKEVLK